MLKELQFGHFYSEMSFNLQQSKYKFCTYTIKSFQCISIEDNFLSVFQSSKSFSVSFIQASLLETKFQGKTTTPARDLIPLTKTQAHQLITGDPRSTQNCLEL